MRGERRDKESERWRDKERKDTCFNSRQAQRSITRIS